MREKENERERERERERRPIVSSERLTGSTPPAQAAEPDQRAGSLKAVPPPPPHASHTLAQSASSAQFCSGAYTHTILHSVALTNRNTYK